VYVQLKGDRSITDLIMAEFRRAKVRVTPEQLGDWLFNDQLLLLLDGVNEIPSDEQRRKLQEFREDNSTTPMIFTTRDLAVGGDLGIQKRLEMRPLSGPQMQEFVQQYLPDHADTLLRQLKDRLREIAETPLLLKMLCDVFDPTTGQIPQSKGELFRLFDAKYDQFKGLAAVSADFRRFKPELLQHLAFCMMQGDSAKPTEAWLTIERNRAETILEDYLTGRVEAPGQRAKEWLEDLLEHHLLQVATDPREIEFHHQIFQEYYAAEELLLRLNGLLKDENTFKRDYLNYLKWTEAIALMLALVNDKTQALRVVKLAIDDVDWILGGRLSTEIQKRFRPQAINHINKLTIPDWLKERLLRLIQEINLDSEFDPSISRSKDIDSESQLYKRIAETCVLLSNADGKQAWEFTHWLDRMHPFDEISKKLVGKQIIPCLLKLADHPDPDMRWCVAHSLLLVGDYSATQALLLLLKDPSDDVRKSAALALSQIRDENSISGLIELLQNPSNSPERTPDLRRVSSLALCSIGGRQVAISAIPLLDSLDEAIRWHAIDILGDIQNELSTFGLISALRDSSSKIRSKAAYSLGWCDDERVVPELINHLWKAPKNHDECCSIVNSLGEIGDERAIPELRHFLSQSDDDNLKEKILLAIGKIGNESVIADLMHILKYSCFSSREAASELLSKMNIGAAAPHIVDFLLKDTYLSAYPSMKVMECLGNFKDRSAAHVLPQLLNFISTDAGEAAFRAIEVIQANCKFYSYKIWQSAVAVQAENKEELEIKTDQMRNVFPNATEVKIFERVEHCHEYSPDSNP
jgi:HEAT repeat protein